MKTPSRPASQPAGSYAGDDARHEAVALRDPNADGHFVYAVKTTGVYCRPSCAARLALRKNVVFHASCAAAERAGYRACKRCRPDGKSLAGQYAAVVTAACRTIKTAARVPDLGALAKAADLSPFHFHRVFTKITGLTPKAYAMAQRAERMRHELPRRGSVTEAIYEAGFNSNGRFYAESAKMLGMKAKQFRAGGPGEVIRFATGRCSLGAILVASSGKGVCAILLGDDADELVRDLRLRFPKAQLARGDGGYGRVVAQVVRFVDAPGLGLDLPLDIRGTAFQQRVWQALRGIPAGKTASYTEVAKRIGKPRAVRAVAGACAANALAVAVPCHRVRRNDGGLSGYRWGVERKRALLAREPAA